MIFVKVSFGWRHRLFLETMWAHSTASQLFMIQIIEIFLHKKLNKYISDILWYMY